MMYLVFGQFSLRERRERGKKGRERQEGIGGRSSWKESYLAEMSSVALEQTIKTQSVCG